MFSGSGSFPQPNSSPYAPMITDPDIDIDSDSDDSDGCSMSSMFPYKSPSVATSHTTHSQDASMRSASPVPSVWSITSSMRAQAFKQEFGRGLNNYSEVYRLPADEEELGRLDRQHELFKVIMGKYAEPLPRIMADDTPGETKAVLDLGCGSGSWIMEVAREFPSCSAVAVDLVPMQSPHMPSNCRSEVDDINLGLEHFYGQFNVVHTQLISSGIKNYASLIDHISLVLRPGGLIHVMEFDFHCYDVNHKRIELDTDTIEGPWWPRWLAFCEKAARAAGGDVDAATHLHSWISDHPLFEDVVYKEFWAPSSLHPHMNGDPTQIQIGEGMRDDIIIFLRSGRPLLLGSGVPEDVVDTLENNAVQELQSGLCTHLIRMQYVYAIKKQS